MAKRRRRSGSRAGRVTRRNAIAPAMPLPFTPPRSVRLTPIADRRIYVPRRDRLTRPAFLVSARRVSPRLVAPMVPQKRPDLRQGAFFSDRSRIQGFHLPRSVVVCVRRNRRREVMFATGKAGQRGQKRPRFNEESKVSCRRK